MCSRLDIFIAQAFTDSVQQHVDKSNNLLQLENVHKLLCTRLVPLELKSTRLRLWQKI